MLYYCKKCGRIVLLFDSWERICDYCKSNVYPVPKQYLSSEFSLNKDMKENFVNDYIKNSLEFDQHLYENREKEAIEHANDFEKYNSALEHGKAILEERARVPKCPSCGSSNISKIGVFGRAGAFRLVGFASSKIGKTHKCNHCGTTW